jgi:hypothetical protein
MKPEDWQQLDELFHFALEREADQRAPFLDNACTELPHYPEPRPISSREIVLFSVASRIARISFGLDY